MLPAPDRLAAYAAYAALVTARQDCRACIGLINPADCNGGIHDSNHIGPWSLWQGNLNADLLIVGQDWGDTRYFLDNRGREKPGNPTNETLRALLQSVGIEIAAPDAAHAGGRACFFTNAVLCLKDGGMQAKVRPEWFVNCGARFLMPTIDLIAPKVVVTLGAWAYRAITAAYGVPREPVKGGRRTTPWLRIAGHDGALLPDVPLRGAHSQYASAEGTAAG